MEVAVAMDGERWQQRWIERARRESASAMAAARECDVGGSRGGTRERGVERRRVLVGEDAEERAMAGRGCA